ncbi:Cytochrome c peroxidase, mitochondrial [Hondaea fermentalgiana]|uniref:inosine/xanthosine triphosphatase n=1 Tax=Hondaea fermentalgiana TaxID=2315210 RepID=A0A2R5GM94_9STRA|nr:Cytochrome c peroxidase, mitochondrial [Hondaea fermentalgiana]|eukprot:GBG29753.1 Cytochrome c peroxidase, mitochondrial [Hondaea fermentalgiana]
MAAAGRDAVRAVLGFRAAEKVRGRAEELADTSKLEELVRELSQHGEAVFGRAHPASQALMFSFDMSNGRDASAAAAASVFDPRVAEAKKRASSEQVFFFNYFSHVIALLSEVFVENEKVLSELAISLRALLRVEQCAQRVAQAMWFWHGHLDGEENSTEAAERRTRAKKLAQQARALLDPVHARFAAHGLSSDDVDTLAGVLAVEELGGPRAAWRPGRAEELPYVDLRSFSTQEKVVLKCLVDCDAPFDNSFFVKQVSREQQGMPRERAWIELYASDATRFRQDFAFAFSKLLEYKFKMEPRSLVDPDDDDTAPLKFSLPEELRVFEFSAAKALPSTKAWRRAVLSKKQSVLGMIEKLTRPGGKVDLAVFRDPHPETSSSFTFSLADVCDRDAAIRAESLDKTLTKFKPLLVPKISESTFYYNYFSHLFQLRRSLGEPGKPRTTRVIVGSRNPVKVNAAKAGFLSAFDGLDKRFEFRGIDAPSGVNDQPMGDAETRKGAMNRAEYCRTKNPGAYAVGIEGGLFDDVANGVVECFAWIAIISPSGESNCTRTATFNIPPALASLVRKGIELGRADDIVHGTTNQKQKGGTVGTLTMGQIDRTQYYAHAVILACAPFANPVLHI